MLAVCASAVVLGANDNRARVQTTFSMFRTAAARLATPNEARPDALAMDAPTHEALVGANNTNDWHGHLAEMGVA